MGVRVESVMLAVLLILSSTVSDGMLIPKCQVARMLKSAVPTNLTNPDSLVAKIVRHAELTSHFNTSIINQMTPLDFIDTAAPNPKTTNPPAKALTSPSAKSFTNTLSKTEKTPAKATTTPQPKETKIPAKTTANRQPRAINPPAKTTANPQPKETKTPAKTTKYPDKFPTNPPSKTTQVYKAQATTLKNQVASPEHKINQTMWTAYGIFQIVDVIACTSPNKSSFNVCNITCDKLINDNLADDITCVWTVLDFKMKNPDTQEGVNSLIKKLTQSFMSTYSSVNYTQYLAECNGF